MGEMMADTLRDEIEIGKTTASENIFKTSISFGRFENDLLSWDKWSSFSQNKYLEEVEKCSTPGSVAEKKAYFEAHYKKIAARKAELLDQEEKMGADSWRSDSPNQGYPIVNGCGAKIEFDSLDAGGISKSAEQESNSIPVVCGTHMDEPNQDVGENFQGSFGEKVNEEVDVFLNGTKSNETELTVLGKEEIHLRESQVLLEGMSLLVKEDDQLAQVQLEEKSPSVKEENHSPRSQTQLEEVVVFVQEDSQCIESKDHLEKSQKVNNVRNNSQVKKPVKAKLKPEKESPKLKSHGTPTITNKKPVVSTPKKPVASTPKKPVAPTLKTEHPLRPRASKPTLTSPTTSTSGTSNRKENSPSLLRSKSPLSLQGKRSTPNSVHMSLSLDPTNSDLASPSVTRRSFIMEKMGDKEIVKRAFRTFQKNLNLSETFNDPKSSSPQQVSTKKTERVTSASTVPQKDKEGLKSTMGKVNSQRGQVDGRRKSVSESSSKVAGERPRSAKATSSTFGLRSDDRAPKRKEEKKEAEIKKLRQNPIKASQTPDKNRGQGVSKIHADKVDGK